MLPSGMPSWMVCKSSPSSRTLLWWILIVLFGTVSYLGFLQGRCLLCSVLVLTPSQHNSTWLDGKFNQIPLAPYVAHRTNYDPYLEQLSFCSQPGKPYLEKWFCALMYCVMANPYPGGGQMYICWLAWSPSFWLSSSYYSHRHSIDFLLPWPISLCWLHYQNPWTNCVQQHHGRVLKCSIKETV